MKRACMGLMGERAIGSERRLDRSITIVCAHGVMHGVTHGALADAAGKIHGDPKGQIRRATTCLRAESTDDLMNWWATSSPRTVEGNGRCIAAGNVGQIPPLAHNGRKFGRSGLARTKSIRARQSGLC